MYVRNMYASPKFPLINFLVSVPTCQSKNVGFFDYSFDDPLNSVSAVYVCEA